MYIDSKMVVKLLKNCFKIRNKIFKIQTNDYNKI